jgi:methylglyoxal synthase|tara:strand:+ start:255 stop:629 length:375 start_codon:yes stop_codon:yes gene_type:complete
MKIAVIAHDGKKADMVSFVMKRLEFFKNNSVNLVGTGTTGTIIEYAGLSVDKVSSGPMGGDAEIGAMVTKGEIDCVIFFRDPLDKHPHDVDISMLMRLCDVHNVPLATNYKSAHIMIKYFKNKI